MITAKEFPNEVFESKEALFKKLKENKSLLIAQKKSEIILSKDRLISVGNDSNIHLKFSSANKSSDVNFDFEKNYYFVVNSSGILDSHLDLHIDGNWEKSIKEQQGKNYFVFDHKLETLKTIALKENIRMFSAYVPYKSLGKNYSGDAYCLVYEIPKNKIIHETADKLLKMGVKFECSVRMMYTDVDICLNTTEEPYISEKSNFDLYYPQIKNIDDFEEIIYFWAVKQAKNHLESSWVLLGSNNATGNLDKDITEPRNHSANDGEPLDNTLEEAQKLVELLNF